MEDNKKNKLDIEVKQIVEHNHDIVEAMKKLSVTIKDKLTKTDKDTRLTFDNQVVGNK